MGSGDAEIPLTAKAGVADEFGVPAYTDLLKLNMASVVWVDKNDGDTKLKLFSVPKSALVEADWLRSQGHRDVQVVQGGLRLT